MNRVTGPLVTGHVRSREGAPAPGVTVTVSPSVYTDPEMSTGAATVTTNGTGDFQFFAPPGIYEFSTTVPVASIEPVEVLGMEHGANDSVVYSVTAPANPRVGQLWLDPNG